jgi:hypothetical protein
MNDCGKSTVATKYMYQRIHEILDMEDRADVAFSLSRLMDELAHNYKIDTGNSIGEENHQWDCPEKDGFGCRCGEEK